MYRRNLPHWYPTGKAVFVTWHLFGCWSKGSSVRDGKTFRTMDQVLDKAERGARWLEKPEIATRVMRSIVQAERERRLCQLHAFVVMPNHIHILITPEKPLRDITKGIKGASARETNQLLGRTGKSFWQDESFDHWVRSSVEFEKIKRYIEYNPVKARLVEIPEAWPYSSATQAKACATG